MQRFVITLIAFALPFVIYAVYDWLRRRKGAGRDPWPMTVLWLFGAVLAVETLVLAAISTPGQPERFTPPYQIEKPNE